MKKPIVNGREMVRGGSKGCWSKALGDVIWALVRMGSCADCRPQLWKFGFVRCMGQLLRQAAFGKSTRVLVWKVCFGNSPSTGVEYLYSDTEDLSGMKVTYRKFRGSIISVYRNANAFVFFDFKIMYILRYQVAALCETWSTAALKQSTDPSCHVWSAIQRHTPRRSRPETLALTCINSR